MVQWVFCWGYFPVGNLLRSHSWLSRIDKIYLADVKINNVVDDTLSHTVKVALKVTDVYVHE